MTTGPLPSNSNLMPSRRIKEQKLVQGLTHPLYSESGTKRAVAHQSAAAFFEMILFCLSMSSGVCVKTFNDPAR